MGTYALANAVHVSAPITAVVAGLLIGNRGRAFHLTEETARHNGHIDILREMLDGVTGD